MDRWRASIENVLGWLQQLLSIFIYLLIYFWLCWVFVSVREPSPVAASRGHSSSRCAGLSLSRPLLLRSTGSRRAGSVIVAQGPSRSAACGILPDQGSNPCLLHWQADSQPLRHQGSPISILKPTSRGRIRIRKDVIKDPLTAPWNIWQYFKEFGWDWHWLSFETLKWKTNCPSFPQPLHCFRRYIPTGIVSYLLSYSLYLKCNCLDEVALASPTDNSHFLITSSQSEAAICPF